MRKTWLKEKLRKTFLYENMFLELIPFGGTAWKNDITMLSTHLSVTSNKRMESVEIYMLSQSSIIVAALLGVVTAS